MLLSMPIKPFAEVGLTKSENARHQLDETLRAAVIRKLPGLYEQFLSGLEDMSLFVRVHAGIPGGHWFRVETWSEYANLQGSADTLPVDYLEHSRGHLLQIAVEQVEDFVLIPAGFSLMQSNT